MKIKVWDKPVRIFHWLMVLAFTGAFLSAENDSLLEYHKIAGYLALGLVFFRIVWGMVGTHYARFSQFIRGWSEVKSYIVKAVKLAPPRYLGHNPAIGWLIIIMLLLIAVITMTGIITYSGEENRGIFAGLFSYNMAEYAEEIHEFLAYLMLALIALHIVAALFHELILKERLIVSIITGMKEEEGCVDRAANQDSPQPRLSVARLVVWIVVALIIGVGVIYLPTEGKTDFTTTQGYTIINDQGFATSAKPNKAWKAECVSCHTAFHPTLLPVASWEKLMAGLRDHFGDNVSLDEKTWKEILDYLTVSSAEHSTTEASRKILHSIKKGAVPIRITNTSYWKRKHTEITAEVFSRKTVVSKSNCIACHPGAEIGSFEDRDIHIPT